MTVIVQLEKAERAYGHATDNFQNAKRVCGDHALIWTLGGNADQWEFVLNQLRSVRSNVEKARNVSGIQTVARRVENDPVYDFDNRVIAFLVVIDAALVDLVAFHPTALSGNADLFNYNAATGLRSPVSFTIGQLSSLVITMNTVVDEVVVT